MVFIYNSNGLELLLDGDLKQSHSVKATITEFPLEDGSFTNDHTIVKPKKFSMSCGVVENETSLDILNLLEKLRDEREVLSIQTNLRLYENFMVEGIDTTEESGTGNIVMFALSFKEVKFSKSKQVKLERKKLKGPEAKDKLQSKTNRGVVDHKKVKIEKVEAPKKNNATLVKGEAVVKQDDNSSMLYRILK